MVDSGGLPLGAESFSQLVLVQEDLSATNLPTSEEQVEPSTL